MQFFPGVLFIQELMQLWQIGLPCKSVVDTPQNKGVWSFQIGWRFARRALEWGG